MNRRDFTGTVLTYGLLQMLWARDLFAADMKPLVGQWFKDLNTLGQDLKGAKLKDLEFQAKMEELYKKVDLAELCKFIELDKIAENTKLPSNGAFSAGFDLGKVEGLGSVTFGKQIFCMKKDRAVVPHGHENMCTGFIVLRGTFRGRHYDRLETHKDHYIVKPTIDQKFDAGGSSTISDHKDNIHWFTCTSESGYIFNAHIIGYDKTITDPSGRLYLDPEGEKLAGGLIKAPKMSSSECHKKFG
ncbi:MAG TPA: hypothetical protein VHR66_27070 [Gemmataceae bacterium]|jgi:hypothetical protein|nr:hypothetical protein [Gemmataceae bacterium]